MFEFLKKGISTPVAIGIILVLAILVGGVTYWQYQEMQKEELGEVEISVSEKEEAPMAEEKIEEEKEVLETPEEKEEEKKEEIIPEEELGPEEISNTTRKGTIFRDEIWSGTIHVTGDIEAESWVTLTILPGTTVYIAANSDDTNKGREETSAFEHEDPIRKEEYAKNHIEINAKIIARGTPDNKILFTSDAQDKKFADW